MTTIVSKILRFLRAHRRTTGYAPLEIAKKIRANYNTVRGTVQRLNYDGLLFRVSRGKYIY